MTEAFEEISPADFFYRNRDIAGFTNPARAVYASLRELVENALDASDFLGKPSEIYIRLSYEGKESPGTNFYNLRVNDNGSGVPDRHIPSAFGQVLFGSKYKLRQARGTFGLGGTMAILYGQITTHKPVQIFSSIGDSKIYEYNLMIDIQRNCPIILHRSAHANKTKWRGTMIEYSLEGDYPRAMSKILEYLKQTAVVNPYANITFIDPRGRLYKFTRATTKMPDPPKEIKPHPHGVDVEAIQRLIHATNCQNMQDFMKKTFHRVSENIAKNFLEFVKNNELKIIMNEIREKLIETKKEHKIETIIPKIEKRIMKVEVQKISSVLNEIEKILTKSGIPKIKSLIQSIRQRLIVAPLSLELKDPKQLRPNEIVKLVQAMKNYEKFFPPLASCLSPLGEELLRAGVLKELKPEFIAVCQRKPSAYSGHPFIVETGIAYGGEISKRENFTLYRFANRIPLLYDEASDVTWNVIKSINWRRYKVTPGMPITVITHICSTKVPYKTVGKEFIADRPEVKREILNGLHVVARQLRRFLSKKENVEKEKIRFDTFSKYLPKIGRFSTELSGEKKIPDVDYLLRSVKKI